MARKLFIPLSAAVAGALIAASPAAAVTCDGLQPALDAAPSGGVVTVDEGLSCSGTFTLPSRAITLQGGGTGATLTGDDEVRILRGDDVGQTVIRNLSFTEGRAGSDGGAAILVTGNSPITVENASFTDNAADGPGGAIFVNPLAGIGDRAARRRAAHRMAASSEVQHLVIRNSSFGGEDENSSDANGGAVAAMWFGPIDVAGSMFAGNVSDEQGGGLSLLAADGVTLTGNRFAGNVGGNEGGGAAIAFCGEAGVTGNRFEDNAVRPTFQQQPTLGRAHAAGIIGGDIEGGGLWLRGNGCFLAARATTQGKGPDATVEQTGNTFHANVLRSSVEGLADGAGEWVGRAELTSTGDVFTANEVIGNGIGRGGALHYRDGDGAALRNFVAAANTLDGGDGGGVYFDAQGSSLHAVHATIVDNAIGEGQGSAVFGGDNQTLLVDNSIIHGNTGGPELAGFAIASVERIAHLGTDEFGIEVDFSDACDGSAAVPGDGNICADPKLANAAGGDVHQTATSPTIDKASDDLRAGLTTDFEGNARTLDGDGDGSARSDMGAHEAPAKAPAQPQQQSPAPSGGVLGTEAHSCVSRRSFRIKLRNHGQKVRKATVIVNGKKVKVLRGKRLTSRVNLRGLPKGRFTVRIKLELANGETISGVRRYFTCRPSRKSGPPKV